METEAGSGGGGRNGGSRDNSPPSRGGNRNEEGPEDSDDGGNDDNHNYVAALLGSINLLEVDDLKMEQYPSESLEILEEINDREEFMKKLDDKKLLAYYEKMFKKQV